MQINVILEAKTRIGKRRLEVDGTEFKILNEFKKLKMAKSFLITIESVKNGSRIMVDVEGDKEYKVLFK